MKTVMAGDMILDNIEEFIFDEDRVVSYKWLSRTLSLHVNHAKRKLEEFTEQWRSKEDSKPITVTFFISGVQETTSGNELTKVAVVKEEDLEKAKNSLKATHCQHIYSVQKSALKDTGALYQTDYDETKKQIYECNKFSAISFKDAQPRSPEDLAILNNQVTNGHVDRTEERPLPRGQGSKKGKPKGLAAFMNKPKAETKSEAKAETKSDSKSDNNKDVSSSSKQATTTKHTKGSLMHAFAAGKKAAKPPGDKKASSPAPVPEKKEDKTEAKDTAVIPEEDKMVDKDREKEALMEDAPQTKETESEKVEAPTKETEEPARKTQHGKKDSKAGNKKAPKRDISKLDTGSKSKQQTASKRRRVVQHQESSSSESEQEEDLEEMMVEEEPEDAPIPPTPEPRSKVIQESRGDTPTGGKRGRKKVWKKKRYVDDEGCMVTEKVFESESGEESEEETTAASKEKKSPAEETHEKSPATSKRSPPSAGRKQSNLTSFFKKK